MTVFVWFLALIIAARFHNIKKKLKDIVNIVHIQEVTLRKRFVRCATGCCVVSDVK